MAARPSVAVIGGGIIGSTARPPRPSPRFCPAASPGNDQTPHQTHTMATTGQHDTAATTR